MTEAQRAESLGVDLGTSGGEWLFTRNGMLFGPAPANAVIEQLLAAEIDGSTPIGREGEAMRPLSQVPFFRVHLARAEARWRVVAEKRQVEAGAARRRRLRVLLIGGGAALVGAALVVAAVSVERRVAGGALREVSVDISPPRIELAAARPDDDLVEYVEGPAGEKRAVRAPARPAPRAPAPSPGSAPDPDGLATETGYDRGAIDHALQTQQPLLFPCVKEAAARDPSLRGDVPFSFTIGNDGRVVKVWVDRDGYEAGTLFACLNEKAARMKFPAFQGERPTVSLSFRVR